MQKIHLLSEDVIRLVRAAEVIQKPVNVVKELLENSFDAGATEIRIKIEGGGKKLIEVSDNGCGMGQDDARSCLLAHATSKILNLSDLESIATLGFRGEALHSISAVSILEMRTKEAQDDVGTLISNMGGQIAARSVGCATGTHISVKALFYNTPARRASLKQDAAETLAITKLVGRYMLVYPQIEFSYYVNNKVHMMQKKGMSEQSVISSILGADVAREMTKVDCEIENVKVVGYVGSPTITKKTSDGIIISVNGRYIESIDPFIKIIRDAYRRSIQGHDFPCAVLRITIDPKKIDPNVHPQKSAIEVLDPELFKRAIFESVLSCQRHLRHASTEGYINKSSFVDRDAPVVMQEDMPLSNLFSNLEEPGDKIGRIDDLPEIAEESPVVAAETEKYGLPELSVIGQYNKTYVIAATPGYLFLIDQHALHEKQLYEELCEKTTIDVVRPPFPFVLNLTTEDSDVLASSVALFKEYGLEMDQLDQNTWKCYSVPSMNGVPIPETEIINLIKMTINSLGDQPSLDDFRKKVLAEIACKSAIRANETLTISDMTRLLDVGKKMKDAFFCPHGRPAVKVYREKTVDKWFKR